jgi:hypothetical protein
MSEDEFWAIVDATSDADDQAGVLEAALATRGADEILAFEERLQHLLAESYSWDLWGVAHLMMGGASDDGFDYFRGWLIGRGRAVYEAALADPQSLADGYEPGVEPFEDEALLYAPLAAYGRVAGSDAAFWSDPRSAPRLPDEPHGKRWDEDELAQRFPRVAERFQPPH